MEGTIVSKTVISNFLDPKNWRRYKTAPIVVEIATDIINSLIEIYGEDKVAEMLQKAADEQMLDYVYESYSYDVNVRMNMITKFLDSEEAVDIVNDGWQNMGKQEFEDLFGESKGEGENFHYYFR